jgi:HK97 family phage major capsid protein
MGVTTLPGAAFYARQHNPIHGIPLPAPVLPDPEDHEDGTADGPIRSGPTLSHSQCVNRIREIEQELSRLAELDTLRPEDEEYLREITDEFDTVNEHRKRLERESQAARVRAVAQSIPVRGPGGARLAPGTGGGVSGHALDPFSDQRGTMSGSGATIDPTAGFDRDAYLEPDSIEDRRFHNPWDLGNVRTFGRSRESINGELRARALSAVEKMPQANDRIRAAATDVLERWDDKDGALSRMCLATSSPMYLRAFSKVAGNREHMLTNDEKTCLDQVRAMSLTATAGGYLVPFQMDPTVIVTANGSQNDIRRLARQVIATGNVWNGITASAVSWSWDAEGAQVSDDSPTFASPGIPNFKAQGFVPISIEAIEDAANVGATIGTLLAEGRDVLEAAAFVLGTGVGQPKGIVTALTGTGSVVNSGTADTLAVGDLYTVQGSLPSRYRRNSSWLANNLFYNRVRQFDTAGGSALWAQLGAGRPPDLLGRPIFEAEDMDGVITATAENYMTIFGDFSNYCITDRIGMTVEFIPNLFRQTAAGAGFGQPTGQRAWYAYYRTGADVLNAAAFRMLNVT